MILLKNPSHDNKNAGFAPKKGSEYCKIHSEFPFSQ